MARRVDTGWRDGLLAVRHLSWGFPAPAPGMTLPMVEYDRGVPLAVINYIRRGTELPRGNEVANAYRALANLHRFTGEQLPFLTVKYDPRNWAVQVFGHNPAAVDFLDRVGWQRMTEQQFAANLYRLRGRYVPDLAPYGVEFSDDPWIDTEPSPELVAEAYPNADISKRRREHEPVGQVRATWRNPCVDLDLMVPDRNGRVAMVVDYKGPGARINLTSTNVTALSSLYRPSPSQSTAVPAFVAQYEPQPHMWRIRVHCANKAARLHLSYVLGSMSTDMEALAANIAGVEWVDISEAEWKAVMHVAAEL